MKSQALGTVQRRMFAHRIDWNGIDRRKARMTPHVLDLLREACLVESYLPIYTGRMLALFWDDLDATAMFTIEAIEAYAHYHLLREYLRRVGHRPITDREVVALRRCARTQNYRDEIRELVNFMGTEHFASHFFRSLAHQTDEPVMRDLLPRFADEERIHSRFAFDLLAARSHRRGVRATIAHHAGKFTHVGAYVAPYVSPAQRDNIRAIAEFDRRFVPLLGVPLGAYLIREGRK
jgi:hypothetical protein